MRIVGLIVLVIFMGACTAPEKLDDNLCSKDYDQTALLTNYADNLIIPGLAEYSAELDQFGLAWSAYQANKDLTVLKTSLKSLQLAFQKIQCFDFGPLEKHILVEKTNPFPLNKPALAASIANSNTNFILASRFDIGLPALEFLVFGLAETDLDSFQSTKVVAYATAIVNDMTQRTRLCMEDWKTYKSEFISNQGTNAGSSLSLMVNAINKNWEQSRRDRVGIPSGVLTLGIKQVALLEAPNGGYSKELLIENIKCSEAFFTGTGASDGPGLDDVLQFLNVIKDDVSLKDGVINNYQAILGKVNGINTDLKNTIENNNQAMLDIYALMSKQTIYLKSDMPSVMCIAITYLDNPSDSD
jgi:hypothetical protein